MGLGFWEALFLGVDSVLIYTFYKRYKQKMLTADIIENAPTYDVGEELMSAVDRSEDKCLAYVGVVGVTRCLGEPVVSGKVDCKGIIHHTDVLQHRSIRFNAGWQDITTSLASSTNLCRFGLVSGQARELLVEVAEPLKSAYLLPNLPIINHLYEPCQQDALSRGLDVLVGNIIRGHSFTEKMLSENTPVLAIGRITTAPKLPLFSHNLLLTSPLDDHHPFILTTLSRSELITSVRGEARLMRIVCYTFGAIGIGVASYVTYRYFKEKWFLLLRWWNYMQGRKPVLRDKGVCVSSSFASRASPNNATECVACLNRIRDLVLMPCKHLCICSDCFQHLPVPKKCPVCRGPLTEPLNIFVS